MNNQLPPDQKAREQAVDPAQSVLLTAPAGSGKTGVLLLRFLRCLLVVDAPEQVVAITYTKKAAAEIRERIVSALVGSATPLADDSSGFAREMHSYAQQVRARDAELGWDLLSDSARLRVSTIDSFTAGIVRRLPLLSGMGSATTADDQRLLYREAALSLLREWQTGGGDKALREALGNVLAYTDNQYERLLPQLEFLIERRDQWLFGLFSQQAGAREAALGEHLTAVFDTHIADLHGLGFATVYAALQSIDAEHPQWGFCAALPAFDQLNIGDVPQLKRMAQLLTSGKGELYKRRSLKQHAKLPADSEAIAVTGDWLDAMAGQGRSDDAASALTVLAKLPSAMLSDATAALNADLSLVLLHFLTHLQVQFDHFGEADYCEIALRAIRALQAEDVDVDIDLLLREQRIEHLLVDEMQDTSVNQLKLLENLCANWLPDDGRSIFFCGDLMQSIYGFRGAVPQLFSDLAARAAFAQRSLCLLQLTANFRSKQAVVEWCNRCFESLTREAGGRQPFEKAVAQIGGDAGRVVYTGFQVDAVAESVELETAATLDIIQSALKQAEQKQEKAPSIAVLARGRSHLAALTDALRAQAIPFSAQKTVALQETPPIRGLLHLLRALWHEADDVAWVGILREPWVGLNWEDVRTLRGNDVTVKDALSCETLLQQLSREGQQRCSRLSDALHAAAERPFAANIALYLSAVWHSLGGPAQLSANELADVERFFTLLDKHIEGGILQSRPAFERQLAELYAAPAAGVVELMTMHGAKGLEYDVVILPQLGRGPRHPDAPLFYSRELGRDASMVVVAKSQQPDEEQELLYQYFAQLSKSDAADDTLRLLYVACTRARRELHLIGSVKETRSGVRPTAGSLLAMLWPVVGDDFDVLVPEIAAQEDIEEAPLYPVIAPRINPDAVLTRRAAVLPPQHASSGLEREALAYDLLGLEDNIESRSVGLVYHEMADRLSRLDPQPAADAISADPQHWRTPVIARLRHHCHPAAAIENSATRVLALMANTLSCEHGRWILAQPGPAWNEQPLLRRHGALWRRLVIDRLFIEDNCCWIIDYKTADTDGDRDAFVSAEAARYQSKMASYREAVIAAGVAPEVRMALYFPAIQSLHVYPDTL